MAHPILINCQSATKEELLAALQDLAAEWNRPGRGHEAHELVPSTVYGSIQTALQDRFNESRSIIQQNGVYVVVQP